MKNIIPYSLGSLLLVVSILSSQSAYAGTGTGDEPLERVPALAKQLFYPNHDETAYVMRASDVIGKPVENVEGKKIGVVRDLVVKQGAAFIKSKQLAHDSPQQPAEFRAIISVGGFLGIGDKDIAVPFQDLMIKRIGGVDQLVYPAGKEQLKQLPAYTYPEL